MACSEITLPFFIYTHQNQIEIGDVETVETAILELVVEPHDKIYEVLIAPVPGAGVAQSVL
jgi:hypothetical protein